MKLTADEKRWLKRLQKCFDECPSDRFSAYTIGDPDFMIFDASKEPEINDIADASKIDFGQAVTRVDAEITNISLPFNMHSTAG